MVGTIILILVIVAVIAGGVSKYKKTKGRKQYERIILACVIGIGYGIFAAFLMGLIIGFAGIQI